MGDDITEVGSGLDASRREEVRENPGMPLIVPIVVVTKADSEVIGIEVATATVDVATATDDSFTVDMMTGGGFWNVVGLMTISPS